MVWARLFLHTIPILALKHLFKIELPKYRVKMVNVAIAGGMGAVGRTLVEVLTSQDKHHAIILTRKVFTEGPQNPYYVRPESC